MAFRRIGVIGAGAWGTALALVAARAGREVVLWGRDAVRAAETARNRESRRYLPGVPLPEAVRPTADARDLNQAEVALLVVPAQTVREVGAAFEPVLPPGCPAVICAKGIEYTTGSLMSEVLAEVLPGRPVAILSGPTFAKEVARGLPTAVTLACEDFALAERLAG